MVELRLALDEAEILLMQKEEEWTQKVKEHEDNLKILEGFAKRSKD